MEPIGELGKGDVLLTQIAALNRNLLALAQEGDWQKVRSLEKNRRALVKNLFAGRPDPVEPRLIQCVEEIVQVDREIIRLNLMGRRKVAFEAIKSSAG